MIKCLPYHCFTVLLSWASLKTRGFVYQHSVSRSVSEALWDWNDVILNDVMIGIMLGTWLPFPKCPNNVVRRFRSRRRYRQDAVYWKFWGWREPKKALYAFLRFYCMDWLQNWLSPQWRPEFSSGKAVVAKFWSLKCLKRQKLSSRTLPHSHCSFLQPNVTGQSEPSRTSTNKRQDSMKCSTKG